ncbi:hypothetical protein [Sphingomonas montanisoli]|uniref:hypothetical protein n=1 Tax=Sphingomonas montanisoli TaxID=2606412 RepID=UPI001FE46B91|nr:hypothetical protein [Sphingomonas montanisoli]
MTPTRVPHLRIVVAATIMAILGYAGFSLWVVLWSQDAAMKGDVIGTWKSFAVLAFGFWLGSSSAGKAKDETPTGTPADPVSVVPQEPAQ